MKNNLICQKHFYLVFLVFTLAFGMAVSVSAADEVIDATEEYAIDVPYEYPVRPGTQEWAQLDSHNQKVDICQIPEAVLKNMTTQALCESVLNYPLMGDMLAYDNPDMGYTVILYSFNGLKELVQREDAMSKLNALNVKPMNRAYCTEDELVMRNAYLLILNKFLPYANEVPAFPMLRSSYTTIRTPKGTAFRALYNRTWDDLGVLSKELAVAEENEYKKIYPNAVRVREMTPAYNCHSYAWYSTSATNKVWINDPGAYMADGSYTKATAPAAGYKAYQTQNGKPIHSGIVITTTFGGANRVGLRSKWGALGLYEHYIYDSPYSYNLTTYWH